MIAVGIPAFNEEKNLASIIAKLTESNYSVIVCNDGSTDMTGKIAGKMGAVVINHPKNLGYGAAIRSIFQKANELNCDLLITFDADGQHRIEDITTLVNPIKNGKADIVIGSRFLKGNNNSIPNYRKVGIKTITKLSNISTAMNLTDAQSGLRAYNKKAMREIILSDSGMGVSTEIIIKARKKGLIIAEVPVKVLYGEKTSKHPPVSHGISVILSTMKFISIEHPLKFYGMPGLVLLTIGLFFIVWTLQEFGETRIIITNLALIGTSSTILGMILLVTAIMLFSLVNVVREKRSGG